MSLPKGRAAVSSILYDAYGNPVATLDGYNITLLSPGLPIMGKKDDDTASFIRTHTDGSLIISDGGGSLTIDGTVSVSEPVSVDDNGSSLTVDDGGSSITIDGTVTANAGTGPWPVTDNGGSLTVDTAQLPVALVGGRLDVNNGAWLGSTSPTVGQKAMASSIPIAIASNQSAIPITDNGGSLTVDGTVTANAGTGPWPVTDNGGSLTIDTSQLPASLVGGRLTTNLGAWFGATTPTVGQKTMVNSIPVVLATDQSTISITSGSTVGTGAVANFLLNGSSEDMVVNGSGTPVTFSFDADPTDDIQLSSLRFVISIGGSFDFDGNSFGEGTGLSNGVEVNLTANGGSFSSTVITFNINEDFARLLDFQPFADIDAIITASLPFGGNIVLEGGSGDSISVVINDNVGLGSRGIDYFTATVYGVIL